LRLTGGIEFRTDNVELLVEKGIRIIHTNGKIEEIDERQTVKVPAKYLFETSNSLGSQQQKAKNELEWLMTPVKPKVESSGRVLKSCDLFSGCGGITVGLERACIENSMGLEVVMGCDLFPAAATSFKDNFNPKMFLDEPIENYVDGALESKLTETEKKLRQQLGEIDVVVGGPPCQGNSNLNNHTRRWDSRNELYMRMIRFVEVVRPKIVLIENVRGVTSARQNVISRAKKHLDRLGYNSFSGVIKGVAIGIPQTRVRHFTLAVLKEATTLLNEEFHDICEDLCKPTVSKARPVSWAIEDLLGKKKQGLFYSGPKATKINQDRMNFLHEHNLWVLPNKERPICQQKAHTYPAVYGRMKWNEPAPTLTTGFGCNGRGKFTHAKEARVLTPHEAARVQTFPDFFSFEKIQKRTDLHDLIGNAVPPLMASHVLSGLIKTLT
jgi:DNA (cytosine-5)-methyltransferase 1